MKFKSFLMMGMLIPCAMAIVACGDDSGSNPSVNGSNGNFVGAKYSLILDEANQHFLIHGNYDIGACIRNEEKYEFAMVVDSTHIERDYAFIGDTLVTFRKKYMEDYGQVFVGGTNGQIKNKWKALNECVYIPESNSIKCADANKIASGTWQINTYYEFTQDAVFISGTDLSGNVIDPKAPLKYEFDDFTNSYYMETNMYVIIAKHEGTALGGFDYPEELFYTADVEGYARSMDVVINSRDKNHISFTYKGQTFEMTFTKALKTGYEHGIRVEVSATFQSDNGSCALDYMSDENMTSDVCKAENADFMKFNSEYDGDGNFLFDRATEYRIGNSSEFKACIESLVKL